MLKLVQITKDYVTKGVPTVHALKGLTINFRRNEFVAILGPSGCGKTTLLNIIGGLDRYTSGNLIIEGRSTKDYKDRDWDTYRNHSIGFVFQTYNLIPHQTILSNVELALTISGIKKEERHQRAMKALATVGLEGMEKKKPTQLSGGQMQRVAIARALVNDPEILLADEPTGALDSQTSLQIMDLLKEVAKDRLVVMVTHNPELANSYANRIVTMKDGLITGDNNPYEGENEEELKVAQEAKKVNKGSKTKTSMSFFTATGLSFANLVSKLKRTILVTIAGSIGIIGVSSVLAVSTGVNRYVSNMQDDMMSRYPLQISEQAVDYTSLMAGLSSMNDKELSQFDLKTEVGMDSMISYLMDKYTDFTDVKTNDINEDLINFIEEWPDKDKYIAAISRDYGLDLTNNIFSNWKRDDNAPAKYMSFNGLTQMYISELKTVDGFSEYTMFVDLFTDFMQQLPGEKDYILSQYDIVAGEYPEGPNEIVLVTDENQTLTDFLYAQMGFYEEEDFLNIAKKAVEEQKENPDPRKIEEYSTYKSAYTFDEILNKELLYCEHDNMWEYKEMENDVCRLQEKMYNIFDENNLTTPIILDSEFSYNPYTNSLEGTLTMTMNDQSFTIDSSFLTIVRDTSIPGDENNPFVGEWFISANFMGFAIDFKFVMNADNTDDVKAKNPDTNEYVSVLMPDSPRSYTKTKETTHAGYMYEATPDVTKCEKVKISAILKKKPDIQFGCLDRGVYYTKEMTAKYIADSLFSEIVKNPTHGIKAHINNPKKNKETYSAYVTYTYTSFKDSENPVYDVPGIAKALNTDFGSALSSMISIMGTSNSDVNAAYLRSLCGSAAKLNADGMSYSFENVPKSISIYPKNFECKKSITKHLQEWNQDADLVLPNGKVTHKEDRHELTYTDTIEIIVNIINTLITTITIALIAFTSLSLVVSCFMIAVITYISTMERVKEIGIIRSLGGRKKDVSRLFIAECLIIGLSSGAFGVGITYVLALIFNLSIIQFGVGNMAILTIPTALIMIGISIVLNVLSGLIPALRASSQDPVVALRTE